MSEKPDFVVETYIRTTPKALWDALVNPDKTELYYYGGRVTSDFKVGSRYWFPDDKGGVMLDGEIVEIVPEKRLVTTFLAAWAPDKPATRVAYDIAPMGDVCKLTITHYEYEKAAPGVVGGWQLILAGLKTYLETGKPLNVPMPA